MSPTPELPSMKATHIAQYALAAVAAGASAAVPMVVHPMTPAAWLACIGVVALAIKGALSVKSEVKGDAS